MRTQNHMFTYVTRAHTCLQIHEMHAQTRMFKYETRTCTDMCIYDRRLHRNIYAHV